MVFVVGVGLCVSVYYDIVSVCMRFSNWPRGMGVDGTNIWQTAVPARDNLGFVDVDEDLGVPGWTSACCVGGWVVSKGGLPVGKLELGGGETYHRRRRPCPCRRSGRVVRG